MLYVRLLTAVVAVYGVATGLMIHATPQAILAHGMGSAALGLVGTVNPVGYAVGCLFFGRVFRHATGKYVLAGGAAVSSLAILSMTWAPTAGACASIQFLHGLSGGAVWPFASAWLLDFQSERLTRTRLLRHYNLAWTSGIASGLFAGGQLCARGWIAGAFAAGAAAAGTACALAWTVRATRPGNLEGRASACPAEAPQGRRRVPARTEGAGSETGGHPRAGTEPRPSAVRSTALLAAALLANLMTLATRAMLVNTYAELNRVHGFAADRMGLLTAAGLLCQLAAFGLGSVYERWLGRRWVYAATAGALAGVCLALGYATSLAVLLPAMALQGIVMAMSFQTSILAATSYFASPRTGTSVHESLIGLGSLAPLAAGAAVEGLKARGWDAAAALPAPFAAMAGLVAIACGAQLALAARESRGGRRRAHEATDAAGI